MTNLTRLAKSPLLLDGFGEFIRHWLGDPKPAEIPEPKADVAEWLQALPSEVTQYWELMHQWPSANLGGQIQIFAGNEDEDAIWNWSDARKVENDKVSVCRSCQGIEEVYFDRVDQKLKLKVYSDSTPEHLNCTVAEYLVTFALDQLCIHWMAHGKDGEELIIGQQMPFPDSITQNSTSIWQNYQILYPEKVVEFFMVDHTDIIWYETEGLNHSGYLASRVQENIDWFEKEVEIVRRQFMPKSREKES